MEAFFQLFCLLDAATATQAKVQALHAYFQGVSPADGAWAIHVLLGRQKRRLITGRRLREICLEVAPWPDWLFDACYRQVGDSAETISLLWPSHRAPSASPEEATVLEGSLQDWMERRLPSLAELQGVEQAEAVRACWRTLGREQLLVVNKLLTGGLRVGVSDGLVMRALSRLSGLEEATLRHRLMGQGTPSAAAWHALLQPTEGETIPPSRPYPFFLASPLEVATLAATPPRQWQVEWKYDGIRCQLIHRQGEVFLWSRGEELLNPGFPDLTAPAAELPEGVVLDGEVVIWGPQDRQPRPFAALQRRLGRRAPGKQHLREAPACFVSYDLLECSGEDLRSQPLHARREQLERLHGPGLPAALRLAPLLPLEQWPALDTLRERARQEGAEGVMLKHRDSPYLSGRRRGHWWKHKLEPHRLDGVLVYAQAGSGRRANLLTDYTFALWDRPWRDDAPPGEEPRLVTFAKAYSGLDDQEIQRLDQWIRQHTLQRFGPVRVVEPELVFELAFEGIQPSSRHKSGIAVRFPRISRWRADKGARQADSLNEALALLEPSAVLSLGR
ncbi:MAG: ATP-dependent DNA ligase [Cyanobacteriota bacterium]|nr:ATP-dependent DNA ligase [Cyanobacteriota bacterium]